MKSSVTCNVPLESLTAWKLFDVRLSFPNIASAVHRDRLPIRGGQDEFLRGDSDFQDGIGRTSLDASPGVARIDYWRCLITRGVTDGRKISSSATLNAKGKVTNDDVAGSVGCAGPDQWTNQKQAQDQHARKPEFLR
jgi:hypothetical protein